MKKIIFACALLCSLMIYSASAQNRNESTYESHGYTLNLGLGIGYYGNVDHAVPVFMINYELPCARNFTLAPFIGFYTYSNSYYWGNNNHPYQYYHYRETTVPMGIKGTYYFDELLQASSRWDFYGAASLGFTMHTTTWDDGYYGDKDVTRDASPLYADIHVGARYHISHKTGIFLDLSTGLSTVGFSFQR